MNQCKCTKSITCKNSKDCYHAKHHNCIVPAYQDNKGMCHHNRDAECLVVENRCDKWQTAINIILHKIERMMIFQNTQPMEFKMHGWPDDRQSRPITSKEKRARENKSKPCFRKGCSSKRGDRGLYCSSECHMIDNQRRC